MYVSTDGKTLYPNKNNNNNKKKTLHKNKKLSKRQLQDTCTSQNMRGSTRYGEYDYSSFVKLKLKRNTFDVQQYWKPEIGMC
jgi:hypothetical protein